MAKLDSVGASLMYGRIAGGLMMICSVVLPYFGVDVSAEDQQTILDAGTKAIDAGYMFASVVSGALGSFLVLFSKYREQRRNG